MYSLVNRGLFETVVYHQTNAHQTMGKIMAIHFIVHQSIKYDKMCGAGQKKTWYTSTNQSTGFSRTCPAIFAEPKCHFIPRMFHICSRPKSHTATMQPCRYVTPGHGPPISGHLALAGHRAGGGKRWQGRVRWTPETRRRKLSLFSFPSASAAGVNLG